MEPRDLQPHNRNADTNEDLIRKAVSIEDTIGALVRHGCPDLTSSIVFAACSDFPCAGGGICNVYQGLLHGGTRIAIKSWRVYDKPEAEGDKDWQKPLKRIARELCQWSKLQHRNVLPLMGLAVFRGHISMISEWAENGDLVSYIRCNPDVDRIRLCIGVCEGLCYIHTSDLIHGDLKASNVLVSSDGTALIADFGNAELDNFTFKSKNTTKGLSVRWAAPELLLAVDDIRVSKEADVYAYGMTALEVLTGEVPYPEVSDIQVFGLVAYEQKVPSRPDIGMHDHLWRILNWCWAQEPSERPRIASVKFCLHALFLQAPATPSECDQASVGGRLGGRLSNESRTNHGIKAPNQDWIHSVPREVVGIVSDQERWRQEAINNIISTEHDFVHDLEYLRDRWVEPLRTKDIIPPERRIEFVQQVFSNLERMLDISTRLRDQLIKRQNAYLVVRTIGDIFLELIPQFRLFMQYSKHHLYSKYELEKEKSTNPAFEIFVETVGRTPEDYAPELKEYFPIPTARLAGYLLLLEAVLKHTPEDNLDRVMIPQAVRMAGEFLAKLNMERSGMEGMFKLLRLDKGLMFRQGEGADLKLDMSRQLLHQGQLKLRAGMAHENSDLWIFLFNDVLVMVKSEMVDEHERREIFRRPILLELLVVSTPQKKAARVPGPLVPRSQNDSSGSAAKWSANGLATDGSTENVSGESALTVNGSTASEPAANGSAADGTSPPLALTQPEPHKAAAAGYRLTVSCLGRKGYSLTLWAPTSAERRRWVEHIMKQQAVMEMKNTVFGMFTRSWDIFFGQATVHCAVPYGNGRRIVYGTDVGVYFQLPNEDQNWAPVKLLDLPDVRQLDVLEEYQLLIVLSERSIIAFPLDALGMSDPMKHMKLISSGTSFFKVGHCLGRTSVCMVETSSLSSTIKMFEPIDQSMHWNNKPTPRFELLHGTNTLKVFKEFSIPTELRSVHLLTTKLCMVCARGFEVVDLETLDTHFLLDPSDTSLTFAQRRDDVRLLSIYRIDMEYLLCYTDFAFYVNESGSRSRQGVTIYWEGVPTAVALHYPYVLAFDSTFIEIRHVDDGSLVQVARGNNLRMLFTDTQPSIISSSINSSSSITSDSAARHPYEIRSPSLRYRPYGRHRRSQHKSPVSGPVHTEQKQWLVYERGETLVMSEGQVMAVRPLH